MEPTDSYVDTLEAMLELLLHAATPSESKQENNSLPEIMPRDPRYSFQQVVTRIIDLAADNCRVRQVALFSLNGDVLHLHAQHGLDEDARAIVASPYLGTASETNVENLRQTWRQVTKCKTTTVEVVDDYGDTLLCLALGWDHTLTATEEKSMRMLFRVANTALRVHRKAASSRRRARWVRASRRLTDALLSGADEEEALQMVATSAMDGSGADAALIFLPSIEDKWAVEMAAGDASATILGMPFPDEGIFHSTVSKGQGLMLRSVMSSPLSVPDLSQFGPMIVAPLPGGDAAQGALVILRNSDREPFSPTDLSVAEAFASQTALAIEVASARHSQSLALLLEERDRISRDLHDFAIQQIFATGMKLDYLREGVLAGNLSPRLNVEGLEEAMESLQDSIHQIRSIVHDLKEVDAPSSFTERIEREASRSRQLLGFAPSLLFELDGKVINPGSPNAEDLMAEMSGRIDDSIAEDAMAVLREALSNIVRHAAARAARVEIAVSGRQRVGELTIAIVDDGRGVDPSRKRSSGLANMNKRARLHGGSFAVGAGPRERGTSLVWRVPLAR